MRDLQEAKVRVNADVVHRGGTFVIALLAGLAVATPCLAIETGAPGGPPNLPPPPPPPLTAAPPGAGSPSPRPKPPPSAPVAPPASPAPSSPPPPADTGPTEPGLHALDTRWFIAPLLGYASENLDFGIGVRGGKTLDNHIYIGGTFVYQIGESGSYTYTTVTGTTGTASWSSGGFYVGPEGGYDFDLKYVVLRPYMGIGLYNWSSSASGGGVSAGGSGTQFVVWPGCMVVWNVPSSNFFIGGDVHVITVPGASFALYAMGGLHFGS